MGLNNKKYLDYAGLEKLVDMHAVVPHPQVEITEEGAYKIAFDEHGHITSKSPLTAADLGVENALHFVGISTTDPLSAAGATVAGHTGAFALGDICLYRDAITQQPNAGGSSVDFTSLPFSIYAPTAQGWIRADGLDTIYNHFNTFPGLPNKTYTLNFNSSPDSVTACQFDGEFTDGDIYPLVVTKISNTKYSVVATRNLPVCVYSTNNMLSYVTLSDTQVSAYEEFIYTGDSGWEKLGDADSYAHKSISVEGGDSYITGGGTLYEDIKLRHKTYTSAAAAIKAIGRDSGGHVVIGKNILVQSAGGHTHDHETSTVIAENTYVTDVTDTHTKLSISSSTATALTGIEDKLANLDTTSIRGVSGTTTVSKATAGTEITVARAGTDVTGLAKRATSATVYGTANVGAGTQVASGAVESVSAPKVNVTKAAYNAEYVAADECLVLSPVTITAEAPEVKLVKTTIKEAVEAPDTQKLWAVQETTASVTPAVANGTITPYTFEAKDVATANATATTVATGGVSVGGAGDAIMTGTDTTKTTVTVLTGATLVKDSATGVDVVNEVTITKNAEATFAGTTDEHTEGTHTHTLYTE